jgi:signal transduction histidine kinase
MKAPWHARAQVAEQSRFGRAIQTVMDHVRPTPDTSESGDSRPTRTNPADQANTFETLMAAVDCCQSQLKKLVDEQAAVRRLATLVAQGAPSSQIFNAVARELGQLLGTEYVVINRYEPDHTTTVVGHWCGPGKVEITPPFGGNWPIDNGSVTEKVARTGRPARINDYAVTGTDMSTWAGHNEITSIVACPVVVEEEVWGMASSLGSGAQPDDTEARMLQLIVFVGAAIESAQTGAELRASRSRVITASDAARRQIERDLHDGVQQRLISLGLELNTAEACLAPGQNVLRNHLVRTSQGLTDVMEDLREITRGLNPPTLTRGGLRPALKALLRRAPVPVELNVEIDGRLAEPVEVAIYYIVSEALTNALKHARATKVRIDLSVDNQAVRVSVHDNGIGGADPGLGSGIVGLRDRAEALGGKFQLASPVGEGTSLILKIPLPRG